MCDEIKNSLGVPRRQDGGGDPWANEHRTRLDWRFQMQDIDGIAGVHWAPDPLANEADRKYGLVALFDRKGGADSLHKRGVELSRALHAWLCSSVGNAQGTVPKFLYVINEKSPYIVLDEKLDATSLKNGLLKRTDIAELNWPSFWDAPGLNPIRNELAAKILPADTAVINQGTWAAETDPTVKPRILMRKVDGQYDGFVHYGEDSIFAEYTYKESWLSSQKRFGLVSLFHRRPTLESVEQAAMATRLYMWLCQCVSQAQPLPPRLFHVVGNQAPWTLIERNINTGAVTDRGILDGNSWLKQWKDLGLFDLRQQFSSLI